MAGFCHRGYPLQNTQRRISLPLCQGSPILGCAWSSFPSKIPSTGKCRHAPPSILEEGETRRAESPSFISNLLAHNSLCSGGIELLSQSRPRLFTVASGNLLLQPLPTPPQWSDQLALYYFDYQAIIFTQTSRKRKQVNN